MENGNLNLKKKKKKKILKVKINKTEIFRNVLEILDILK